MISDIFGQLLTELSKYLNIDSLQPDEQNICLIGFKNQDLKIILKAINNLTDLEIYCELGELPQGRYLEEVLHESLRANELPYPRYGNFGFNTANHCLVLWELMPLKDLNGADLAEYLQKFKEKSIEVKEALQNNTVPTLVARSSVRTGGLFGLR